MARVAPWLAPFPWEMITAQNAVLCQAKGALHKPTSDGHEATRNLWNERHREPMPLEEAVDLCRRCHRMAPFCFYNGNTFASVIALVVKRLPLAPAQAHVIRSLAGHIVAGVSTGEEEKAFAEFCASLDDPVGSKSGTL
ncbi:MAG: hypothetical protein J0L84_17170 [Verrucomicrobia bacterium]|nr:hypothetical protein [Verrucomicrobiota bacterium]